jgi:hypothetical protein
MLQKTYTAIVVCMYCKTTYGIKGGFTFPNLITHGICDACLPGAMTAARAGLNYHFVKEG